MLNKNSRPLWTGGLRKSVWNWKWIRIQVSKKKRSLLFLDKWCFKIDFPNDKDFSKLKRMKKNIHKICYRLNLLMSKNIKISQIRPNKSIIAYSENGCGTSCLKILSKYEKSEHEENCIFRKVNCAYYYCKEKEGHKICYQLNLLMSKSIEISQIQWNKSLIAANLKIHTVVAFLNLLDSKILTLVLKDCI